MLLVQEVLFRQGKIDQAELEWAKAINAGFPEARAYLGLARVRNARAMYKSAERNDQQGTRNWTPSIPTLKNSGLPPCHETSGSTIWRRHSPTERNGVRTSVRTRPVTWSILRGEQKTNTSRAIAN